MTRARVSWLLVVAAVAGCHAREHAEAERRPDVIVILIDTRRADRVGWYGGGTGLTPSLDGLANEGTVFWNAYAPGSWTCPVVASLFTSRFLSQHRVETYASVLDPSEQTLAEELRVAGYATAAFTANVLLNAGHGYGQGFDEYRVYGEGLLKARASVLTRDALAWIDRTTDERPDEPFFLYLHLMEPHEPLQPPTEALEAVAARAGTDPARLERLRDLARSAPFLAIMPPAQVERARELYDAEVASLDLPLHSFFTALAQLEILQGAIVIVTADHGEEFLEHGGAGHGHTLYNEVSHVPLLARLPQQQRRIDVRDVVSLVDLAPTILDAAGVLAPAAFEGRSRLQAGSDSGSAYSEMTDFEATEVLPKLHARAAPADSDGRRQAAAHAARRRGNPRADARSRLRPPRPMIGGAW